MNAPFSNIQLLLAWRCIKGTKNSTSLSTMMLVCGISILLSTCALTLVAAVMQGFERATYEKLQGIHSDLIIESPHQALNYPAIANVIDTEFNTTIAAHSPTTYTQLLLQSPIDSRAAQLVLLQAIDPTKEARVSRLPQMIISPQHNSAVNTTHTWTSLFENNAVVIGDRLAEQLSLTVGDTVDLLYNSNELYGNKITFQNEKAYIGGIFKTGIYELDEQVIFSSLDFIQQLLPEQEISRINVQFQSNLSSQQEITAQKQLAERLHLSVQSWKELYPALVSALALEKYAMIFILSLVAFISSMNIIALLFMLIQHRQKHIAVLISLGMTQQSIRRIFLLVSILITATAAALGIAFAWLLGIIATTYHLIELPDIYYVHYLPIDISIYLATLVFIFVIILGFIATLIPLRSILGTDTPSLLRGTD